MRKIRARWLLFAVTLWAVPSLALSGSSPLEAGGRRVAVDTTSESFASLPGSLSPSGFVLSFRISPDSRYAVYGSSEAIYSRRLPDGPPVQLARPDSCWAMSSHFLITDDSATVLFTCWSAVKDLWSVPIAGPASAAVRVSTTPDAPYQVSEFFSSTSDSRILYAMPRVDPFRVELYSVPAAGPAAASVAISSPLAEGDQVRSPIFLQLSAHVIYEVQRPWPEGGGIWRTGGAFANPIRIGDSPASHPMPRGFVVTPDEQRVVWAAMDEFDNYALYSAPISDPPGIAVQLNGDGPSSSLSGYILVSPDSARAAFFSTQENPQPNLYSVPVDGPSAAGVNLSGFEPAWFPQLVGVQFSPDSAWVLYLGDREVYGRRDLYAVPAAGPASANVRLNPIDPTTQGVDWYETIPATADVVFSLSGSNPEGAFRCYRGSWLGAAGNATPLWTEPLFYSRYSTGCHWVAESQGVLAATRNPYTGSAALWLAHGDGPLDPSPQKLLDSAQFEPNASPFTYGDLEATPDGRFVVYLGQPLGGDLGLGVLPLPFFWDGFESGGTGHWSATLP